MSLTDFESKLKALFSQREQRDDRLLDILRSDDDLISVVLRGHLVVEELLLSAIAAHCQEPEHLGSVQLRFPQLIALLRSLQKIPAMPERLWTALAELNVLRNSLAHNLEPHDLTARVERFVKIVGGDSSLKELPGPPGSKEALRAALSYLLGAMGVVAVFQVAVEELIRHRLMHGRGESEVQRLPSSNSTGAE
jgi:hypothetical protein